MSRMVLMAFVWLTLVSLAYADPTWKYHWMSTDSVLETETGGVTLSAKPEATHYGTSAEVLVAKISLFGSFASGVETLSNAEYAYKLLLEDVASGQSGELTFRGELSGSFSMSSVQLTNVFLEGTQSLDLGDHVYFVTMSAFVAPGPLESGDPGYLKAFIEAVAKTAEVGPTTGELETVVLTGVPEPATLTLLGLGLPAALAWRLRRRQSSQA